MRYKAMLLVVLVAGCAEERRMPPALPCEAAYLPQWCARLRDADPEVRFDAQIHIRGIGAPAITFLMQIIEGDEPRGRLEAIRALTGIRAKDRASVVPALIERLTDEDPAVQDAVVHTLRSIGPAAEAAVPALWKTLRGGIVPACLSAPHALAAIQREQAVPGLVEALSEPGPRAEIIRALGVLGPAARAALPRLEAMASDESVWWLQPALEEALPQIRGESR